jgi:hypothetical protein
MPDKYTPKDYDPKTAKSSEKYAQGLNDVMTTAYRNWQQEANNREEATRQRQRDNDGYK